MKKSFVVVIVLIAGMVFPQSIIDLYSPVIPQKLLNKVEDRQMVETNLEFYSEIHPAMIGYYILYMDNRFGRKISDPADNFSYVLHLISVNDCKIKEK